MPCYKENEHNSILLLFSCPGQKEKECDRPCAGRTGENLKLLLEQLHILQPNEFPKERDQYYINNAWDQVEYAGLTGRTEASDNDLRSDKNINRLKSELSNVKKIICFGDKAKIVIDQLMSLSGLKNGIPVYFSPHLGFQSINRKIKNDIDHNDLIKGDKDNTPKRLAVIAKEIIESCKIVI